MRETKPQKNKNKGGDPREYARPMSQKGFIMIKTASTSTKTASANYFTFDHVGKRIKGSEANFKKAEIFGTAQYEALMVAMERHPAYTLTPIAPEFQKQSYKGLNFELMMDYVEFKGTKVQQAEFEEIVNRNSTFPVIKSWFVENFKVGFTVEKAKREIESAKRKMARNAAQETLKVQKSNVRKVVKAKMVKAEEAKASAPIALASNF